MLLIGHAAGVASSYLFAIGSVSMLSAVVVNDCVLYPGRRGGGKQVHLAAYAVGEVRFLHFLHFLDFCSPSDAQCALE
jgi:hypothetical protein